MWVDENMKIALDECSPINIHKLIGWLGKPAVYIFDCDRAGSKLPSQILTACLTAPLKTALQFLYTYEILFRKDVVLASLFRNYLLAQRLISLVGLTSVSMPELPDCSHHSLWETWELVMEASVLRVVQGERNSLLTSQIRGTDPVREFFRDQLRAFSVWLRRKHNSADAICRSTESSHGKVREAALMLVGSFCLVTTLEIHNPFYAK
ncbi:hypothetical protein Pmar_PMAR015935 [Perkinsus marinus ATCC 50983]|uniref:Uncharacterized protein n=1 Tax=Perkinsus marinus (strain ATCC 50983 / TXsc) TaxID=423536 RepID=C5L450_PERM5|nr:hypothetical protein Pmar_PMAR015935 [Perkinsus marinus ATCC 50983]EER08516.1 hypothetical protein Pmar_PMAR015935 [Perkinsus marinus ATCC 50983]|eukprot:XP_002776700.1 hypothetical protein Pmar_PMAR015935 [Perkinsus marinus ATCC 50983]